MNPCLMLCRNSLALTKKAIASVLEQDISVALYVVDNESTDGTASFLRDNGIKNWRFTPPKGVSASWNFGLDYLFDTAQCEHVLVVNNDIQLRNDCARTLIEDGGPFVTAVSVGNEDQLEWDGVKRPRPNPDFSCFLIRREVWDTVGTFDDSMVIYASDGDFHLRMHQAGIEACTIGIPFYHVASGTLKTADPEERTKIQRQADIDRETFRQKWGVSIGSPEYYALFGGNQ